MPARQDPSRPFSSSAMKIVPILVILIVVAAAAYYFFVYSSTAPAPAAVKPSAAVPSAAPGAATTAATSPTPAPAPPAPEMSKEQLLKEARTAFNANNLVTPAGSSALELYMRVLDKDPNNASARDALREDFQYFTSPAEQLINKGDLDEANRVIDLLTKVDPSNFTLNILRSKLEAKKKQVDHDQQVAAAAAARAAAAPAQAAQSAATTVAPATAPTEPAAAPAAAPVQTAAVTPPATPRPQPATTPAPAPVAAPVAAASGESHGAELVRAVQPDYPPDAYRSRAQGWVEVEFTVTADGAVSNAQVVNSEPARVFNNAALNAVRRWTFRPKLDNGRAVDERIRRRIEFKLS
jgi:periplasmic protein TonB